MDSQITIVDHPLVQHKLTLMRDKEQPTAYFRQLLRETALLLAYEVTRDLPLETKRVETPIEVMDAPVLAGKKLCFVSVLRAGNGLLEGMLDLLPSARVGHVGLYRDPETLEAVEYYYKVPTDMKEQHVILVDPMLATGNSAIAAIDRLMKDKPTKISFACLLAAPEGVKAIHDKYPEVDIFSATLDERLNEKSYIVPGLGDAGDRIYNT